MKYKKIVFCIGLGAALLFTACGKKEAQPTQSADQVEMETETPPPAETKEEAKVDVDEINGVIKSFTGGKLIVTTEDDQSLEFDLSEATLECENGILAGDEVTVIYEGTLEGTDTSNVVARKVIDKGEKKKELKTHKMVGTVSDASMNTLTIKNGDGDTITFVTTGAQMKCVNGLELGNWVTIKYKGELKGTNAKNLKVISVTDKSKNVDKEQEKVEIKAMNRTVYTTASVNLRESYTTDSNIVITAEAGSAFTQTGETDTGWARVEYNGTDAYVYEQYLSDEAPATPTPTPEIQQSEEESTMYATVAAVDSILVTVTSQEDNSHYVFNWSQAEIDMSNGLSEGSHVVLYYKGQASDSPFTATLTKVCDQGQDKNAPAANQEPTGSVTGTVIANSMNTVTVAADDGAQITFAIENAQLDTDGIPEIGEYVAVMFKTSSDSNLYEAVEIADIY